MLTISPDLLAQLSLSIDPIEVNLTSGKAEALVERLRDDVGLSLEAKTTADVILRSSHSAEGHNFTH